MIEELSHTADIGIRIETETKEDLFKEAGRWLTNKLTLLPHKDTPAKKIKTITLQELSEENLLIRFLNEIIYLYEAESLIFTHFIISFKNKNQMSVSGNGTDIRKFKKKIARTEIKAATYHQLELKTSKGKWQAVVFFDV